MSGEPHSRTTTGWVCEDCGKPTATTNLCVRCAAVRLGVRRRWRSLLDTRREITESGCWLWTGHVPPSGYGQYNVGSVRRRKLIVHRLSYEMLVGPIPEGKELHHTCGIKRCFNPDHLLPLTHKEHCALHAATACPRCGSTDLAPPKNSCRPCRNRTARARRASRKAGLA